LKAAGVGLIAAEGQEMREPLNLEDETHTQFQDLNPALSTGKKRLDSWPRYRREPVTTDDLNRSWNTNEWPRWTIAKRSPFYHAEFRLAGKCDRSEARTVPKRADLENFNR
jgi:hypothetical protein